MNLPSLSKTYDGRRVLDLPALTITPGEITAVIGTNGSGKSTLAQILAGVIRADGRFALPEKVRVGYLPQKSYAFRMTTEKNIRLNGDDPERLQMLMDALGLMPLRAHRAKRLSGGETARMALARLLMRRYDLLILDEPTAAMDISATLAAEKMLSAYLEETGCAMLLITHSLRQAQRLADRVLFLQDGRLVEQGSAAKTLQSPETRELQQFLEFSGI